jgi:hypothetical protein
MPVPEGIITTTETWKEGEPDAVNNKTIEEIQEGQVQEAKDIPEQTLG